MGKVVTHIITAFLDGDVLHFAGLGHLVGTIAAALAGAARGPGRERSLVFGRFIAVVVIPAKGPEVLVLSLHASINFLLFLAYATRNR